MKCRVKLLATSALLKEMNYRVVTSAGTMALEEEHNFIYVLTPERLLYLLIHHRDKDIDYLFIDEAHKSHPRTSVAPSIIKT